MPVIAPSTHKSATTAATTTQEMTKFLVGKKRKAPLSSMSCSSSPRQLQVVPLENEIIVDHVDCSSSDDESDDSSSFLHPQNEIICKKAKTTATTGSCSSIVTPPPPLPPLPPQAHFSHTLPQKKKVRFALEHSDQSYHHHNSNKAAAQQQDDHEKAVRWYNKADIQRFEKQATALATQLKVQEHASRDAQSWARTLFRAHRALQQSHTSNNNNNNNTASDDTDNDSLVATLAASTALYLDEHVVGLERIVVAPISRDFIKRRQVIFQGIHELQSQSHQSHETDLLLAERIAKAVRAQSRIAQQFAQYLATLAIEPILEYTDDEQPQKRQKQQHQ